MKILFTFAGGSGHFEPLEPVARAAMQVGHRVRFACQSAMVPIVEAAGFSATAAGGATLRQSSVRTDLLELDADREDRALRNGFADRVAGERAAALLELCRAWQPEVIVRDEVDFGSAVVAERLGLPCVTVLVIASGAFIRTELVSDPLNRLRAVNGLAPDPALTMLSRSLVLAPFPPRFRDPRFPLPKTTYSIRPAVLSGLPALSRDVPTPNWAIFPDQAPLVYFTLGTIFNLESGNLFSRVLTGLQDLPVNVIVTVGREIDPGEFGPQPDHIHIERYIPQAQILPHCSAVISHGGSGSVIGALAYGLPSVLIPMGADQPLNAARCQALGVSGVLDPVAATPDDVRSAVETILTVPAYRQAARQLQKETTALPGPEEAVAGIERLRNG